MLVLSANREVRAIVELDEDDMKALRKEYDKIDSFRTPVTDDLVSELINLAEDDE